MSTTLYQTSDIPADRLDAWLLADIGIGADCQPVDEADPRFRRLSRRPSILAELTMFMAMITARADVGSRA